ncbi:oligosaccharide flippase family protein [Sphingobacterium populi]|uniref:oligosaccharide flippase family protein n=1 Tax=Sphingobacterium sp. CFCC 11742 TaxID=1775560 RepID=UPI000830F871|nr:oligosaccharide flippase family protein [Sphingobacterium sp. CFCC 11742]
MIDANNKRIAKNTLFLYIRMLLIIFVNLYTVRIVLQELGTEDYGIYNLVGGVVAMFSFLSQSLSSASQRFFALEIGKNNSSMLASIVNTTLWTYIFLAIIIFGIGQLLGSWFLNEKLTTIPLDRVSTANFVFNCSMISLVVSLLSVPFNALIIANEKMNVYSYISIFEVVFKLISVFLLQLYVGDKLRLYAIILLLSTSIVGSLYFFYCQKNYPHIKYSRTWDKSVQKKILSFTGWNMFDSMANVMNTQGMNIFLGYFFGPLVNAGRGVAYQVSVTLNQFVLNFVTATKPQIVKYYAQNELAAMQSLVFRSSKFSFYLLAVVTIPFFFKRRAFISTMVGRCSRLCGRIHEIDSCSNID